jgi:hypothetical protein
MSPAKNWGRTVSEISQYSFEITHAGSVALECAVMDLHIETTVKSKSAPLEVACPPPRTDIEKVHEFSSDNHSYSYPIGSVVLKCAVVNLHNGTSHVRTIPSINSSALEVACPPPGIGVKI